VVSNRSITDKNELSRDAVISCACETLQLLSVVCCVFTAVLVLDLRLVLNGTLDKRRLAFVKHYVMQ
jgi:hypothetical protein